MKKFSNDPRFVQRWAHFSACRRYRYRLEIIWDPAKPIAAFIGLNPSTADEWTDDPTVRRCRGFAEREDCGGLRMLNLFAFRATDPADMKREHWPIGRKNHLNRLCHGLDGPIIACWGTHGTHLNRHQAVCDAGLAMVCFGLNCDGTPKHPLYLKATAPLMPFSPGV